MLLTNHSLTGVVLGLNVTNPVILAPAAFISHLALDSIPHFGSERLFGEFFDTKFAKTIGVIDCFGALTVYLVSVYAFPNYWLMITIGVFFACLPDLFYLPQLFFGVRLDRAIRPLHGAVQWSQTVPGLAVDTVWAAGMIHLIQNFH